MKSLPFIVVGAALAQIALTSPLEAQTYNRRRMTQRLPQQQPPAPAPTGAVAPAAQATDTNATVAPIIVKTQVVVRVVQPPPDPEKVKAEKAETLRRTVEFQKKRADEGSESAQYELGIRYLKGDGVEKDEPTGRKWLEQSAKNGFSPAAKKLEDLNKTSLATAPPEKDGKPTEK